MDVSYLKITWWRGLVAIPEKIRAELEINRNTDLKIYIEKNKLVLEPVISHKHLEEYVNLSRSNQVAISSKIRKKLHINRKTVMRTYVENNKIIMEPVPLKEIPPDVFNPLVNTREGFELLKAEQTNYHPPPPPPHIGGFGGVSGG